MKTSSILAFAILGANLFAPMGALAQASVADPGANVPPVVYQSVFGESPTGVETRSEDWKKANAEVAQFKRGHVDILKWEESQTPNQPARPGAKLPGAATPAEPAKPAMAAPAMPHKH